MTRKPLIIASITNPKHLSVFLAIALGGYVLAWPLAWLVTLPLSLITEQNARLSSAFLTGSQYIWMEFMSMVVISNRLLKNPFIKPNEKYLEYLAFCPWQKGKQLPLGSCFYTIGDVLLACILMSMGTASFVGNLNNEAAMGFGLVVGNRVLLCFQIGLIFSLVLLFTIYLVFSIMSCKWKKFQIQLLLILIPLLIYPHFNVNVGALVLTLIYFLCVYVTNQNLKTFQWEWPFYDLNPVDRLREEAQKSKMIVGSMKHLAPNLSFKPISLRFKIMLALTICWWLQAVTGIVYISGGNWDILIPLRYGFMGLVLLILCTRNIARFLIMSPVYVYARPFIGKWSIGKFDGLLIMPILMGILGFFMTWLLIHNRINFYVYLYVTAMGFVLIHHLTCPTQESWQYTWNHSKHIGKQPDSKKSKMKIEKIRFSIT